MCSRNKEQSFYQNMNYTESEGMPFIHHNQNKCFKSYVRNDELFNFGRCFIHLIFKYSFDLPLMYTKIHFNSLIDNLKQLKNFDICDLVEGVRTIIV